MYGNQCHDRPRTVMATRLHPETRCVACQGLLDPPRSVGAVLLAACQGCGSRTSLPRPTADELKALHNSPAYFEKEYFTARRNAEASTTNRLELATNLIKGLRGHDFLRGRRMLDVGCDTGDFLIAAKAATGIEPYGVDVSTRAVRIAADRGIIVSASDPTGAPVEFEDFALVTVIDVLEHVARPVQFLESLSERLAADGLVYVETPNWRSTIYLIGERLARVSASRPRRVFERLFPPEHVQYFTVDGIRGLIERTPLQLLDLTTRPLGYAAVAGGKLVKGGTWVAQLPDRRSDEHVLICTVLGHRTGAA